MQKKAWRDLCLKPFLAAGRCKPFFFQTPVDTPQDVVCEPPPPPFYLERVFLTGFYDVPVANECSGSSSRFLNSSLCAGMRIVVLSRLLLKIVTQTVKQDGHWAALVQLVAWTERRE